MNTTVLGRGVLPGYHGSPAGHWQRAAPYFFPMDRVDSRSSPVGQGGPAQPALVSLWRRSPPACLPSHIAHVSAVFRRWPWCLDGPLCPNRTVPRGCKYHVHMATGPAPLDRGRRGWGPMLTLPWSPHQGCWNTSRPRGFPYSRSGSTGECPQGACVGNWVPRAILMCWLPQLVPEEAPASRGAGAHPAERGLQGPLAQHDCGPLSGGLARLCRRRRG